MNKLKALITRLKSHLKTQNGIDVLTSTSNDFEIDDFDHRPYYELVTDMEETRKK